MNGFMHRGDGKHAAGSLNAAQNRSRAPKHVVYTMRRDEFGGFEVWRTVIASGAKLWRAVCRRKGFRRDYYKLSPKEFAA